MKLRKNQLGAIHMPIVAAIVLVGVIGFTAGVAYRIQTSRSNIEVASSDENELREIKEVDLEEIIAVLPAERKQSEPEEEKVDKPAPAPPEPKPISSTSDSSKDKTTSPKDKKYREPTIVKISNITITKANTTYTLTASFPRSYSGTCQGLLKPESGGNPKDHITVSRSFSGTSCSVDVTESQLEKFTSWSTYMSFYSSDKTMKSHWTQADTISP